MIKHVIIQTHGFAFDLCDETSPLNTDAFWTSGSPAERLALVRDMEARGDCVTQEVVLDGSFKVQFDLTDRSTSDPQTRIRLPTGSLVIRSGRTTVPVAALEPGTYGVTVAWDANVESKHYDIAPSQYPASDGPDGIITVARLSAQTE